PRRPVPDQEPAARTRHPAGARDGARRIQYRAIRAGERGRRHHRPAARHAPRRRDHARRIPGGLRAAHAAVPRHGERPPGHGRRVPAHPSAGVPGPDRQGRDAGRRLRRLQPGTKLRGALPRDESGRPGHLRRERHRRTRI
ncbi:hypothetical protein LTR94_033331, partial [Friedmanniomyces endolithicus]